MTLDSNRKLCLAQQTKLRQAMQDPGRFHEAIRLFLQHHAMLHSGQITQGEMWSYEDSLLNDMLEEDFRRVPKNQEHSIAWIIWHIARCEDITVNILINGSTQILFTESWFERMNVSARDTGNAMDRSEIYQFSQTIDINALRGYRLAVGMSTREIVEKLTPQDLTMCVDPSRLQQVFNQGAVVEKSKAIAEYWGRRNTFSLLMMPATRHNLVHLNEIWEINQRKKAEG